jgi:hypothetical protein
VKHLMRQVSTFMSVIAIVSFHSHAILVSAVKFRVRYSSSNSVAFKRHFTLISLLGAYIGSQHSAFPDIESTFFVFTLAVLIACFKATMYIKLLANKQAINYESLFLASWRNAIIFAITVLFMMIFFGIL